MNRQSDCVQISLLLMLLCVFASSAVGQTFITTPPPENNTKVGFRFLHPNYKAKSYITTFTGTYDLYVNMPVSPKINLELKFPFSGIGYDSPYPIDSKQAIGNIYFGFQYHQPIEEFQKFKGTIFSFGVNIPTADKDEWAPHYMGLICNEYEAQRILPEVFTISGNAAYWMLTGEPEDVGGYFGFELGPQLFIPTGDNNDDTELMMHYGLTMGLDAPNVAIFAEFLGVFAVTSDVDDFGERFDHFVGIGMGITDFPVRPSLYYQIPLDDDLNDFLSGVFGIKVEAAFPTNR
ncbi:MAG: hypothetical protein V3V99_10415 [candidate division Zixibacteria bacterium]